jgi:hypothetical protein
VKTGFNLIFFRPFNIISENSSSRYLNIGLMSFTKDNGQFLKPSAVGTPFLRHPGVVVAAAFTASCLRQQANILFAPS